MSALALGSAGPSQAPPPAAASAWTAWWPGSVGAAAAPAGGVQWYLLAQSFPSFLPFFSYVLRTTRAAVVPLGLRYPCRLDLLLLAQAVACCLLGSHPSIWTAALWMVSRAEHSAAGMVLHWASHICWCVSMQSLALAYQQQSPQRAWRRQLCLALGLPAAGVLQAAAAEVRLCAQVIMWPLPMATWHPPAPMCCSSGWHGAAATPTSCLAPTWRGERLWCWVGRGGNTTIYDNANHCKPEL